MKSLKKKLSELYLKWSSSLFPSSDLLIWSSAMNKAKIVLVIRNDLNMSEGKIVSQTSHAVADLIMNNEHSSPLYWELFDLWSQTGMKIVTLCCDSQDQITRIENTCKELKVPHTVVRDAGRTQVPEGSVTCMGIGPLAEQTAKKLTGNLALY